MPEDLQKLNSNRCYVSVENPIQDRLYDSFEHKLDDSIQTKRTAVIVAHGMGQQIRYETIDMVADLIRACEKNSTGRDQKINTRHVQIGEERLGRAEIKVTDVSGDRDVHIYETYWAPLTESKINLWSILVFMVESGLRGLDLSLSGKFEHWLFDDWRTFRAPKKWVFGYAVVLLVFLGLVVINATIISVAAVKLIVGHEIGWLTDALFVDITADLSLLSLPALLLCLAFFCIRVRGAPKKSWWRASIIAFIRIMLTLAVAGIIVVGAAIAFHIHFHQEVPTMVWWATYGQEILDQLGTPVLRDFLSLSLLLTILVAQKCWIVIWWPVFWMSFYARRWFLQYMGDVAIYLSSHKVSAFYNIREAIQEEATRAARAVYSALDRNGNRLYDNVIMVGNSLGAVIIYDVLNRLINEERLMQDKPGQDYVNRTRLLLTMGCPLDISAFVFRAQNSRNSQTREALAASCEPMIVNYGFRPQKWINIYSPNDIISGSLTYYDIPGTSDHKRVVNKKDEQSDIPFVAHNMYWHNKLFLDTIYEATKSSTKEMIELESSDSR
jgi:hypothetical protein